MSKALQLLLLLCVEVHCASAAPVDAAVDSALDRLYATRHVRQVAISPDAKQVAWVEPVQGRALGATAIMVAPLPASAGAPRRVTAGDGRSYAESEIAWSPD